MDDRLDEVLGIWGRPAHPPQISDSAREFLGARLGPLTPRPRAPLSQIRVPASRLAPGAAAELSAALGPAGLRTDDRARLRHSAGSSLTDYVAVREATLALAPDAVAAPASHDEVVQVLRICREHDLAVVPFGGGTSVVGGVAPLPGGRAGVVAVAFDRMADLIAVDEESLTATVQPGITGPVLERLLAARGLMWGHLPQSWERAVVGGYIATRSAGQASTGYGRSDESVEALTVATPNGTVRLGRAPSSAAGPDLRQLFVGSEGILGIITEVVLRVRRQPHYRRYEALIFPDFSSGATAFRALAQAGLTATVMRLSDEAESEVTMAMSGPSGRPRQALDGYLRARGIKGGGALAILGWEGVSPLATKARREAAQVPLRRCGAVSLGGRVGQSWLRHRFDGPYLRDLLLDEGCIVETLETAAEWSRLRSLHDAVGAALRSALAGQGSEPIVFSHVSHVYPTGASLYFTAVAPAAPDRAEQWRRAKRAASEAIMANGGTITHHHAVGADHAPWLRQEVGDLGVDVLRAVKAALDPQGIMNPGKLLDQP